MTEPTIAELLAAADPTEPVALGGLIERLTAEGRLRGARRDGRAIGAAGLADDRGPRRHQRLARGRAPARCSWPSRASTPTGTTSSRPRPRAGAAAALVEHAASRCRPAAARRRPTPGRPSPPPRPGGTAIRARELAVVGITGTDGKTTTSFLAVAALEAAGIRTGMTGTAATRIGGVQAANEAHATTPEAPELQRALRAMLVAGDAAAVIETTSHGLALDRVDAIAYDVAILTNLTHEHLELHGTWEAYRDAKLRLFEKLARRVGAAGTARQAARPGRPPASSTPTTRRPARSSASPRRPGARVLTYGTDPAADVRATRVEEDQHRLRIAYEAPSGAATRRPPAGRAVQRPQRARGRRPRRGGRARPGGRPRGPRLGPGRARADGAGRGSASRSGSSSTSPTARPRCRPSSTCSRRWPPRGGGGLIAVFGSAGERDTAKRPLMGRIAGERARIVVVTDEDPRGEDREAILDEIARGAEAAGKRRDHDLLVIADRRAAIEAAIERARPGDIVLLAGKGHEQSIIGPDGPRPWNERAEAEAALHRAGFG